MIQLELILSKNLNFGQMGRVELPPTMLHLPLSGVPPRGCARN